MTSEAPWQRECTANFTRTQREYLSGIAHEAAMLSAGNAEITRNLVESEIDDELYKIRDTQILMGQVAAHNTFMGRKKIGSKISQTHKPTLR